MTFRRAMQRWRPLVTAGCALWPLMGSAQNLPEAIAASKEVRIATSSGYPPLEIRDPATGELGGFDIDLAQALAGLLGVKPAFVDGAFEQLMPSVQSGRTDLIMGGLYDLPKRRGVLDFIDYLRAGGQFFVPKDSPVKTLGDLCGQTVSVIRGTNFPDTTKIWSDRNCVAAGRAPLAIIADSDLGQQLANLKQGRAAAGVQGLEAVPAIAEMDNHGYRAVGEPFSSTLIGMAFLKTDPALRDAFAGALKRLITDGTYATLIKKWKLDLSSYTNVSINLGPVP